MKEYYRKYYLKNQEKIRAQSRSYKQKNPEKIREYNQKNQEKMREYHRAYAKLRRKNDPIPLQQWREKWQNKKEITMSKQDRLRIAIPPRGESEKRPTMKYDAETMITVSDLQKELTIREEGETQFLLRDTGADSVTLVKQQRILHAFIAEGYRAEISFWQWEDIETIATSFIVFSDDWKNRAFSAVFNLADLPKF